MARDREQFESLLSAYLDGELTDKERAEVETLLAGDPEARRLLDDLRTTVAGLNALPRAKVSDDFSDALRAHLERRALLGPEAPLRIPRVSSPASAGRRFAAAAIIVLATFAGYFTWSFTREPGHGDRYALKEESSSRAKQASPGEMPSPPTIAAVPEEKPFDQRQRTEAFEYGPVIVASAAEQKEKTFTTDRPAKDIPTDKKAVAEKGRGPESALRDLDSQRAEQLAAAPTPPSHAAPASPGADQVFMATADGTASPVVRDALPGHAGEASLISRAYDASPSSSPAIRKIIAADTLSEAQPVTESGGPSAGSQSTMPVLGPDFSSRPGTRAILAQATDAPARREAFIVAGSPILAEAAATAPSAATRPASATKPSVATRPTPTSTPTNTRAITTQTSSAPNPQ